MKVPSQTAIDSALFIAVVSALFYYLGLSLLAAYASAFSLPSGFFRLELWDVVALGGRGLLSVLLFPLNLYSNGKLDSLGVSLLVVFFAVVFIIRRYLRATRYVWPALALWLFFGTNVLASHAARERTKSFIDAAEKCLLGQTCQDHNPGVSYMPATVVLQKGDGVFEERLGVPFFISKSYLVLVTKNGVHVSPLDSLRTVDAVRTAPSSLSSGKAGPSTPKK